MTTRRRIFVHKGNEFWLVMLYSHFPNGETRVAGAFDTWRDAYDCAQIIANSGWLSGRWVIGRRVLA